MGWAQPAAGEQAAHLGAAGCRSVCAGIFSAVPLAPGKAISPLSALGLM